MKKILIAAVLLVLIVALSYVKTYREHDRSMAFYNKGTAQAGISLDSARQVADSLQMALAEKDVVYADSLTRKDQAYRSTVDSLENLVDETQNQLEAAKAVAKPAATLVKTSAPTTKTLTMHEKILQYYKDRYAQLPKDLSAYERRIAINEIREETSLKFNISLEELKKIRTEYKLTY
ncbi:MAG: hypothetical protein AB1483_10830 [Candidatus Zixiibacteriota bacterium]